MRRTRACVPLNPWEHQGTRFRSESPWPRLPHHATRWLHSRSPSLALQLTAVHAVAGAAHMNHDAHMHGSREESLTSLALTSTRRGGPCRQERLKTGSLAPALGTTLRAPHGGDGCPPRYTRASWSEYRRGGGGGGERAGERVTRGGKSACVTGSESDARPSRGVTGGCACGACGHQHTWPHAATRGVGEAGGECDAPSRGRRGGGAGAEWGGEGGGGGGAARAVRTPAEHGARRRVGQPAARDAAGHQRGPGGGAGGRARRARRVRHLRPGGGGAVRAHTHVANPNPISCSHLSTRAGAATTHLNQGVPMSLYP